MAWCATEPAPPLFCAAHGRAPADEVVDGVRFVRRGDHLAVYVIGMLRLLLGRFGKVDLVVDVQNGLPFFTGWSPAPPWSCWCTTCTASSGPSSTRVCGRVGWWIERVLAPRLYRAFAVRRGVAGDPERAHHPGRRSRADRGRPQRHRPRPRADVSRSPAPLLCVLGRLVPHKQVEHAIDAIVALRADHPDASLVVVGNGWWEDCSAPTWPSGARAMP